VDSVVRLQAELEVKVAKSYGELHAAHEELDALRRVATLIARGVHPAEISSAVSVEVSRLFGSDISAIVRFERDGTAIAMGVHGGPHALGARFQLEPGSARIPDVLRALGIQSGVASPIVIHGEPWGALVAATAGSESLPEDPQTRIAAFAELVAISVSNEEARESLRRVSDERAGLQRVATLIAEGAPASELFCAVTREVGVLLGADISGMARFEGDDAITTATWAADGEDPPVPDPWPMRPGDPARAIADARRAVRWDDWTQVRGSAAAFAREELGVRSTVGVPIVVQGQLWGVLAVHSKQSAPLPADTETRLRQFSDLVATAIGNAEARTEVAKLANEHAALRRVATLVARAPASQELFLTVAREVAAVLDAPGVLVERFETDVAVTVGVAYDVDLTGAEAFFGVGTRLARDPGSLSAQVFETRRTARVDYSRLPGTIGDAARAAGFGSGLGGPILVHGELWGQMCVLSRAGTVLPVGTEDRLHDFIDLVATAIANYEARARLSALADEQAALRRVAMLVAEDAPPDELFRTVTFELGTLLGADFSGLARFEEAAVVPLAVWAAEGQHPPVPDRWPMQPGDPVTAIAEARQAVRWDDWSHVPGPIAALIRDELGVRSTVGTPIVVEGRLWGALAVHSKQPLPRDSESRMEQFSELVATSIANAQARAEVARLANEQAALRRVATLIATEASPTDVFAKVAEEAATILGNVHCTLLRDEGDGTATVVGTSTDATSGPFPVGTGVPVESDGVLASVLRQSQPRQIGHYDAAGGILAQGAHEHGIQAAVGCPILVRNRTWGALVVVARWDPCPPDTERRLAQFADLVATAVGNAEARAEIKRLADEQTALRRVATLVAHGARPADVFAAVSQEVGRLFGSDTAAVFRFDSNDPALVVVGASRKLEPTIPVGTRLGIDGPLATAHVYRTGQSARFDALDRASLSPALAEAVSRLRVASSVASPIILEGRRWGAVSVASRDEPLPLDAGERLERFSELVATAIANTDSRAELAASRKRIVAASDEARRRIERDLHDGTQQRLVTLALAIRAAEANVPPEQSAIRSELSRIASGLGNAVTELQEISRGIHPAILAQGGVAPALRTLARRSTIPVELEVRTGARLPEPIEVAAYYVASEALANAAKHAHASRIEMSLEQRAAGLLLEIRDDGVGGADPSCGSGLLGLSDRVEALGGSIRIQSRPGNGTSITVELPLEPDVLREPVESA
jgi:GAF domain-containing protein